MDYSRVRGFNYQPSYGSSSFENWLYFKPDLVELELRRGKHYFPKMNVIRIWLSWEAFKRNNEAFANNFEFVLDLASKLDLLVIPTLFNRWHSFNLDNGGIYIDHLLPTVSSFVDKENLFQPYLETIVKKHKNDKRILIWDICNEPFSYKRECFKEIELLEFNWLEKIYNEIKNMDAMSPVGISMDCAAHGILGLKRIEPISDVLLIHPYYIYGLENLEEKKNFTNFLDKCIEFHKNSGKPMLVTETCWGSLDDYSRVENIKYTLSELKKRNFGWLVHALNHSLVIDLHREQYGPVGSPGFMGFIEADGSLRPGHEIFNKF
jgi:endo-1,4-beta-mannosidase